MCGVDGGIAQLTLGTGELEFEPLQEGQRVPLVAGSQGGYHVWLGMRASGLCEGRHDVRLEVRPAEPAPKSVSNVRMSFDPVAQQPGQVERVGWPARVFDPWCAVDQTLELHVTVDTGEQQLSTRIEIVPTAPEGGFGRTCEAS